MGNEFWGWSGRLGNGGYFRTSKSRQVGSSGELQDVSVGWSIQERLGLVMVLNFNWYRQSKAEKD